MLATPWRIAQTLVALSLAVSAEAPAQPGGASCEVEPSSVVSRSPSGVAQVSNLELIHVQARVPHRPLPASGTLAGLRVEVTVHRLPPGGTAEVVPSSVTLSGGGGDSRYESAGFTLDIPIDPAERDAAIREYVAELSRSAASSPEARERELAPALQGMGAQVFAQIFRQHRVGRFRVECRVLDGGRVLGIARADLEVLFKGRFFDQEAFRKK